VWPTPEECRPGAVTEDQITARGPTRLTTAPIEPGSLCCWGNNSSGQLGAADSSRYEPTQVL
jgi:hypothetical protein